MSHVVLYFLAALYTESGVPTNELYFDVRPMPLAECTKVADARTITSHLVGTDKVFYCVPDGPVDEVGA